MGKGLKVCHKMTRYDRLFPLNDRHDTEKYVFSAVLSREG